MDIKVVAGGVYISADSLRLNIDNLGSMISDKELTLLDRIQAETEQNLLKEMLYKFDQRKSLMTKEIDENSTRTQLYDMNEVLLNNSPITEIDLDYGVDSDSGMEVGDLVAMIKFENGKWIALVVKSEYYHESDYSLTKLKISGKLTLHQMKKYGMISNDEYLTRTYHENRENHKLKIEKDYKRTIDSLTEYAKKVGNSKRSLKHMQHVWTSINDHDNFPTLEHVLEVEMKEWDKKNEQYKPKEDKENG